MTSPLVAKSTPSISPFEGEGSGGMVACPRSVAPALVLRQAQHEGLILSLSKDGARVAHQWTVP
jgi:hypothetical protein